MKTFSDPLSATLLGELGDDLGLNLVFDKHSQCLLVLDDNLMISIHEHESVDCWVLYGMLGEFWQPDQHFFQYLLLLNQSLAEQGQGALAFDPKNDAVLYLRHIPLKDTNRAMLYQLLENFTDQLETIIDCLNESEAGRARIHGPAFNPMTGTRPPFRRI